MPSISTYAISPKRASARRNTRDAHHSDSINEAETVAQTVAQTRAETGAASVELTVEATPEATGSQKPRHWLALKRAGLPPEAVPKLALLPPEVNGLPLLMYCCVGVFRPLPRRGKRLAILLSLPFCDG